MARKAKRVKAKRVKAKPGKRIKPGKAVQLGPHRREEWGAAQTAPMEALQGRLLSPTEGMEG